jgi:hypothetical protein
MRCDGSYRFSDRKKVFKKVRELTKWLGTIEY